VGGSAHGLPPAPQLKHAGYFTRTAQIKLAPDISGYVRLRWVGTGPGHGGSPPTRLPLRFRPRRTGYFVIWGVRSFWVVMIDVWLPAF
jgi:hypothetical protein